MGKRRIVDAHHHLWDLGRGYNYPWLQDAPSGEGLLGDIAPIARDYKLADYRADTANYELVKSVHIEAVPADAAEETSWLQGVAETGGFPQAIVARVELQQPDAERAIAEHRRFANLRGIRHIVNWHANPKWSFTDHDFLSDEAWLNGFPLLKKYDLSFDLQLYPGQMPAAARLARRQPRHDNRAQPRRHASRAGSGRYRSLAQRHAGIGRMRQRGREDLRPRHGRSPVERGFDPALRAGDH